MCVCVCGERDEGRELEEGSSRKGARGREGRRQGRRKRKRKGEERGKGGREGAEGEREVRERGREELWETRSKSVQR